MKLIFIVLFLSLFYSSLFTNEDDMWNFTKQTPKKRRDESFLAGQKFILGTIKLYQSLLSEQQGDVCNFTPSCSHYAYGAIKKEGVLKGSLMAIDRLQRCNPWSWDYLNKYYRMKWVKGRGYKLCDPP